jgi:hypothetical protein
VVSVLPNFQQTSVPFNVAILNPSYNHVTAALYSLSLDFMSQLPALRIWEGIRLLDALRIDSNLSIYHQGFYWPLTSDWGSIKNLTHYKSLKDQILEKALLDHSTEAIPRVSM